MKTIIEVKNLYKQYGNFTALKNVSFTVNEGEILGILGPNGAGKSTLLEILETLNTKTTGTVSIDGLDLDKDAFAIKKIIGVQLQSNGFFNNLNLVELINLFAGLYETTVNALYLLQKVGLEERAKSKYKILSGGQKQRFAIANALINKPKVLFLDEPTTGLDPQARRQVWNLIQTFREQNITVIITTHYMEEAEFLCDRVGVLDSGTLLALDKPSALIENLLSIGFAKNTIVQQANLEDVYMHLTGKKLAIA